VNIFGMCPQCENAVWYLNSNTSGTLVLGCVGCRGMETPHSERRLTYLRKYTAVDA